MNALMLFVLLTQVTGGSGGGGSSSGCYHEEAAPPACVKALKLAVEAVRAAWAPRRPKPKLSEDGAVGMKAWTWSGVEAQLCHDGRGGYDNCCLKPKESERLRCSADKVEQEEAEKAARSVKEFAAINALDAVDEACGDWELK